MPKTALNAGDKLLPEQSLMSKFKNIISGNRMGRNEQKGQNLINLLPRNLISSFYQSVGKAKWMPREFSKFADLGYIRNVIAYRSINMLASSAASVPWMLYENTGEGRFEVRDHPILDLLKKPNAGAAGTEFFENLFSYRLISGNAFILAVFDGERNYPSELHLLRPDSVDIIEGKGFFPAAYRYKNGNDFTDYKVNQITGACDILHIKNFHPTNEFFGLSPMEAAAYSIDQHNEAGEWNKALLQNGARPSGALVVKMADGGTANLNDEQYQRIKNQIDEQLSGGKNSGRPLLLEGGLDWKEMSVSPRDMDFLNCKHSSARDIALAFGVPPQMLGIPGDNNYGNLAEARVAMWEQTIIPMLKNVADALNGWLSEMFRGNFEIDFDDDQVTALAAKRDKIWQRAENANFLTMNEKRQMVGFDTIEGGDKI